MKKIIKTSFVLLFFAASISIFQLACDTEADALPALASDVKPAQLLIYFKYNDQTENLELWSANYDGTNKKLIFTPPVNTFFSSDRKLNVSPDGTKIYLSLNFYPNGVNGTVRLSGIYSINIDGSNLTKLIEDPLEGGVLLADVW